MGNILFEFLHVWKNVTFLYTQRRSLGLSHSLLQNLWQCTTVFWLWMLLWSLNSGFSSLYMCFCCLHSFFIPKVFVLITPYFFFPLGRISPFILYSLIFISEKTSSCYSYWMLVFFFVFSKIIAISPLPISFCVISFSV